MCPVVKSVVPRFTSQGIADGRPLPETVDFKTKTEPDCFGSGSGFAAGIYSNWQSRSSAAALALIVQYHGVDKIDEGIQLLLEVRPFACPNPLITLFADEQLGCNGELHEKAEKVANAKIIALNNR